MEHKGQIRFGNQNLLLVTFEAEIENNNITRDRFSGKFTHLDQSQLCKIACPDPQAKPILTGEIVQCKEYKLLEVLADGSFAAEGIWVKQENAHPEK